MLPCSSVYNRSEANKGRKTGMLYSRMSILINRFTPSIINELIREMWKTHFRFCKRSQIFQTTPYPLHTYIHTYTPISMLVLIVGIVLSLVHPINRCFSPLYDNSSTRLQLYLFLPYIFIPLTPPPLVFSITTNI